MFNILLIASTLLSNLTSPIQVKVELINMTNEKSITEAELQKHLMEVFVHNNLDVEIGALKSSPLFHLQVYAIPAKDSYSLHVSGRLFEKVDLGRVNGKGYQAITWEKQRFINCDKDQIEKLVKQTVRETAKDFTQSLGTL